jgi:hypothetical protein
MPIPRPTPGNLKWWVLGAVWVVGATAVIAWVAVVRIPQQVSPLVTGYHVVSASTVTVDYDVRRPANTVVDCLVTALDEHHGRVGAVSDEVPASPTTGTVHRTVTVRTSAPAVTGLVESCTRRR